MVLKQTHFLRHALARGASLSVKRLFLLNNGLFLGFCLFCLLAAYRLGYCHFGVLGQTLGGFIA
jgi:hypothetical protein